MSATRFLFLLALPLAAATPSLASESKVVDIITNNGAQVSTQNLNSTLLGLMQQRQNANNYPLAAPAPQPASKSASCESMADSVGFVPCLNSIAPAAGPETPAKD